MIFLEKLAVGIVVAVLSVGSVTTVHAESTLEIEPLSVYTKEKKDPELCEEIWYDDLEILAQLVEAEAGNQDLIGRQLVVDVVLNRVDDPRFPGSIREVIYQRQQFSCLYDGNFDRAGNDISELSYEAVRLEVFGNERIDSGILYFSTGKSNGKNFWKWGSHWFSY